MPAPTFIESGSDATQDLTLYSASTGTVASSTAQAYTGPRSINCNAGNPAVSASVTTPAGTLADAGRRISFRYRFDSLSLTANQIFNCVDASALRVIACRLASTGILNIDTGGGGNLGSGTKVLAVNTWYRITFSYTVSSTTVFTAKLYVDGVLDATAVNSGTLARTGSTKLILGLSSMPINTNCWIDDIYIDDGSDYTDPGTARPRSLRVTAKRPFANGTANNFTTQIGAGGSGYGSGHAPQVNEQPLSVTNGWAMVGVGAVVTEEYNGENRATGDVDLTGQPIVGVMGWAYAKSLLAETGKIIVDGTQTNIALTNANTMFQQVSATPTVYPAGSGADIGIVTDTTVTTVSLYECGLHIAYEPYVGNFFLGMMGA